MAVVSHPALSSEWSFSSPLSPFDTPSFSSHIELADHAAPMIGAVHQLQVTNKRRAHEIEWDDESVVDRVESRVKKAKTSTSHTVDPQQLHGNPRPLSLPPVTQAASSVPSPQIEQVISILVDALTSSNPTLPPAAPSIASNSQKEAESRTVSTSSSAWNGSVASTSTSRPVPTSPLSGCPNRAPFTRKVIGGSCAGKTEASLSRWVLCRNHFLGVRSLDPTNQPPEWVHTLHEMGWEELHPFYQKQTVAQDAQAAGALSAFSRWIEDEFDYDGTEDSEGDWSDEEEDDGELHDEIREDEGDGQRGVWDSGVVLQLPGKLST